MASPIEEDRRAFQLRGLRTIGEPFWKHLQQRADGNIPPLDPDEVIGDAPHSEVPVQIVLDKGELNPPSKRLQTIKEAVIKDKKRIVITSIIGGVAIATIGAFYTVRHFIDRDPHSDITDK